MRRRTSPCQSTTPPEPVKQPAETGWFPSSWAPYGVDMSGAITVHSGDNLQAALTAAEPGAILLLEAGATWQGNFTLPPTEGSGEPILLTTTAWERLPPPGTRITPESADLLPRLLSVNSIAALEAKPRSHHWRMRGLRFASETTYNNSLLRFGSGSETTVEELCHHFDVMQCWIEGHEVLGCKRGIQPNGIYITIRDCWISNCKSDFQDSQAVCGWNVRWLWTENCFLEGAGENYFLTEHTKIPGWIPSDAVLTRCHLYKPLTWKGEFDEGTTNPKWVIKNLFELKAGRRVHVHSNVFENVWPSGQRGSCFNIKPGTEHTATVPMTEDVLIEYNLIVNAATTIQLTGVQPSALGTGYTRRVTLRHNAFTGMKPEQFLTLIGGTPSNDIRITDNTILAPGFTGPSLYLPPPAESMSSGLEFARNICTFGAGVKCDGKAYGTDSLCATYGEDGWIYEQNVLIGPPSTTHPPNNAYDESLEFGDDGYSQSEYALGCDDALVTTATGGVVVASAALPAMRRGRRERRGCR